MTRFIFLSLMIICVPLSAFSQQAANATLTGTITDQMSAVVAGAQVTATHKATGIKRETVSNDQGFYVLSNMTPGDYELLFEAKGFAKKATISMSLKVGQTATVNARLDVAANEAIVDDITYSVPLVDNSTSVIDGVIVSREVESLPLNGRNFLELALLVPGNSPAPNFDPTKTNTVVISSAGQLGRGGNVTIDGADTNDDVVGGSIQNISQ
ncbi:MAG TPA: carboxypeptidase-like regulatory domain-containing protein, partial [Pyrinomonadaceae bacterium]|nr:carboxypeptidase-like regulatory domain-containing protein [Pyrinomonadaceae bacterium]